MRTKYIIQNLVTHTHTHTHTHTQRDRETERDIHRNRTISEYI